MKQKEKKEEQISTEMKNLHNENSNNLMKEIKSLNHTHTLIQYLFKIWKSKYDQISTVPDMIPSIKTLMPFCKELQNLVPQSVWMTASQGRKKNHEVFWRLNSNYAKNI